MSLQEEDVLFVDGPDPGDGLLLGRGLLRFGLGFGFLRRNARQGEERRERRSRGQEVTGVSFHEKALSLLLSGRAAWAPRRENEG